MPDAVVLHAMEALVPRSRHDEDPADVGGVLSTGVDAPWFREMEFG
jgi:hypothetical protein